MMCFNEPLEIICKSSLFPLQRLRSRYTSFVLMGKSVLDSALWFQNKWRNKEQSATRQQICEKTEAHIIKEDHSFQSIIVKLCAVCWSPFWLFSFINFLSVNFITPNPTLTPLPKPLNTLSKWINEYSQWISPELRWAWVSPCLH